MEPRSGVNPDAYVLGTDAVEIERLGVQHRLWADAAHDLWRRLGVTPGSRVLDVGCGPGFASLDLAQWVTTAGEVLGVDESSFYIDEFNDRARARGLDHARGVVGDVRAIEDAAPDSVGSFDAAYARWVLCFVSEPGEVVASIARMLRPGGRVGVHDYFNYEHTFTCAPRDERFDRVVGAISQSWRDRGGSPDVVGRLPKLMEAAGLRVESVEVHQRVARPGTAMWSWPNTFWPSVLPRLVASGHLSDVDRKAFESLWADLSRDGTRFMLPPAVFEVVAVKPE